MAFLSSLVGLVGGAFELGKLIHPDAFGYLGVAFVFGAPAATLAIIGLIANPAGAMLKVIVELLLFLAGPFLLGATATFLRPRVSASATPEVTAAAGRAERFCGWSERSR